jgi:2-oxoglutarate dehydrogenase E2 component (dihydrolipoamide succinyltransferase)
MATDVVMPQMGESIAEGTIVRWIKKVGDSVERDEPLFEISTDKVDAEIPSPIAGVITEIRAKEGETVPVNSVVAIIGAAGAKAAPPPAAAKAPPPQESSKAAPPPAPTPQADGAPTTAAPAPAPQPRAVAAATPPPPAAPPKQSGSETTAGDSSIEDAIRQRSSPLVRKIAKEHNVDISQIRGSGIAGRVTKDDILSYIAKPATAARGTAGPTAAAEKPAPRPPVAAPGASSGAGQAGKTVPMSIMRKKIAEHMVLSRKTSAHVHSVFEVNFGRVAQIRAARKAEYEQDGAKLTYLSFILKAAVDALRSVSSTHRSTATMSSITNR